MELPNLWVQRDYPVLLHVANYLEVEEHGGIDGRYDIAELAQRAELPEEQVTRALVNLHEGGFIQASTWASAGYGLPFIDVSGLTERGRREVGLWPGLQDSGALVEVFENAARHTDDDETRSALQQIVRSARNVGEGTLASIAAALVTKFTMGA